MYTISASAVRWAPSQRTFIHGIRAFPDGRELPTLEHFAESFIIADDALMH